ncbi:MAG: GCN5-related N-acetyltransferase [Bacteroidetes bacterium]|nr:GCN5-related N-acetyltransferase [Bacteroidota bacterium]
MKKTIETERLYLCEFALEDAQLLIDLNSDREVTRYTGDGPVKDLDAAKKILSDVIFPQYKNNLGRWAVHLRSTGEFIGWCGLKHIAELNEIDLGYRFFQKHWGQGYATEAAKAVMEYGATILNLETIVGRAAVGNLNSIKVLEKAGLTYKEHDVEHGDEIVKYVWGKNNFDK